MHELTRKIIHIDMDAFYAAVEQRDFPELRGIPIIVGGASDTRGVVATCSYEARKYGIHSSMPAGYARRLCPEAIFIQPRFDVYREVSLQIQSIFLEYTDQVEAISLDEAYLDVTHTKCLEGSATLMAREIKEAIRLETGLTASAGVSYNKFLAKIASDLDKPDGLTVIRPQEAHAFIQALPIGDFHGVGPATKARMNRMGIETGADLLKFSLEVLVNEFGKSGHDYYLIARGIDQRPVIPDRIRKSWGAEKTFDMDLLDRSTMLGAISELSQSVLHKMKLKETFGTTVTLKVKYDNFELVTRARTLGKPIRSHQEVAATLEALLDKTDAGKRKVRLLGVSFSNLHGSSNAWPSQMDLFRDLADETEDSGGSDENS